MTTPAPTETELLRAWQVISGLITSNPKRMATKTRVENALMAMFDIDRDLAHHVCNMAQSSDLKPYHPSGVIPAGSKLPWASQLYAEMPVFDPFAKDFATEYELAKRVGDARFGSECKHESVSNGTCTQCLRKVK